MTLVTNNFIEYENYQVYIKSIKWNYLNIKLLLRFFSPTIAIFKLSRSRKTLSSAILPISDLIVVWANWDIAYSASSTPYDANFGSNIFK
jgi:hypothetical protein